MKNVTALFLPPSISSFLLSFCDSERLKIGWRPRPDGPGRSLSSIASYEATWCGIAVTM